MGTLLRFGLLPLIATLACGDDSGVTLKNDTTLEFSSVELSRDGVGIFDTSDGFPLSPGAELTIGADCGIYDVVLGIESSDECYPRSVDICLEGAVWVLDDDDLVDCTF
jgi:hypothetical protein